MSKEVQVGNKVIRQLEVKLFVTSMLLQELLDEGHRVILASSTKLKHHISGLQNELDKVLSVDMRDDSLSMFITDAISALEKSID